MIPRISRWKHSQPPKKLSHASFFGLGGSISGNRCRWIRRMQDRVQREAFSRASLPPLSLFPFFFHILFPTSTHFSSAPSPLFFNTRKPARVDYFGSQLVEKPEGKVENAERKFIVLSQILILWTDSN